MKVKEWAHSCGGSEKIRALAGVSVYNEKSWLEAMVKFDQWMLGQKRVCDYNHMLSYLACISEYAQSSGPLVEFHKLLLTMLEDLGYDGPDKE